MFEKQLIHRNFNLRNTLGYEINGDIRYLSTLIEKPVIIVCHSFMAFKDWGFFPYVSRMFAEAGYVSVIFNFSLNGVVGNENRITDFNNFSKNTFSQELDDLQSVIDYVWEGQIGQDVIDRSKIILLGHSRGGGIALLQASRDDRIKALISWSTISTFDRWTKHQKEEWRELGYLPLGKNTDVSPLKLGIDLLNDVELNRDKLDLIKAAAGIKIPWLIIHGKADIIVPYSEAEDLYQASNHSLTDLNLLDKVGHLYNAASQDEDNYETLKKIVNLTLNWLKLKIK